MIPKLILFLTCVVVLSCCGIGDLERTQAEFDYLNIELTDNIIISKLKSSGLTDYVLNIEFEADSISFYRISEYIKSQPGFFSADTTEDVKLINRYPYIKKNVLYWERYNSKNDSYEYRRLEIDCATRAVKYHFLTPEYTDTTHRRKTLPPILLL